MRLSKWHGLGNDYLLLEQSEPSFELTPERVARLCDYHFGVGSDGIVEIVSTSADEAEARIWNPDGSLAELSGNGVRIAARWLARRSARADVQIRVGERTVEAHMLGGLEVETEMGDVTVGEPETLDLGGEQVEFIPVSVGNPHAVIAREPERIELLRSALSSNVTRAFPNVRTSNSFTWTIGTRSPSPSGNGARGRRSPRARARSRAPRPRSRRAGAKAR